MTERARNVRRVGVWLLALVMITFAGDRMLAAAFRRVVLASELRFSRIYRGGMSNDILVLGNSRGVNAFDAPLLEGLTGLRTFNASYNGMSPILAEAVLADYLERNRPPRLLILEVTNVYGRQEAMRDLRLYRFASQRIARLDDDFNGRLGAATKVSHLFGLNNELFSRSFYYLGRSDQTWGNRGRITPDLLAATDTMHYVDLELPESNLQALERMVQVAREGGVQVVLLIVSPFLPGYHERIANFDSWLMTLEERLATPVHDYSRTIREPTAFADRLHLNRIGAKLFAANLLEGGAFVDALSRLQVAPSTEGLPTAEEDT